MSNVINWKNSEINYGVIAKLLHWGTALLFLAAYISVYYRQWFTLAQTSENWFAKQMHLSIGVSIAVCTLLRIVWKITNTQPKIESVTALEHRLAKLGHMALYGVMIIMPVTGYLGTRANVDFFYLFEIPRFADTWLFKEVVNKRLYIDFQTLEVFMDFIHKQVFGTWLVWMLITGHIVAALYHHFVKQDKTLNKMSLLNNSNVK